jgi:hypothetical protein
MFKFLIVASCAVTITSGNALANGVSEARSYQFRSPSERQVLLSGEQIRLNFKSFEREGLGGNQGGQTGNSLSIAITGNGDNVIDTGQENTGNQTIQEGSDTATNEITGDPAAAIAAAATRLETLRGETN